MKNMKLVTFYYIFVAEFNAFAIENIFLYFVH